MDSKMEAFWLFLERQPFKSNFAHLVIVFKYGIYKILKWLKRNNFLAAMNWKKKVFFFWSTYYILYWLTFIILIYHVKRDNEYSMEERKSSEAN